MVKNLNKVNQPSTSSTNKEKDNQKKEVPSKDHAGQRDIIIKEVDKTTPFSLDTKISKLKVFIPLTKLVKNNQYNSHVAKMLKVYPLSDMMNLEDDDPKLIFGLAIDGKLEDSKVPPFYLSLRIH